MKIGILTLPFNNNYGGYLQAYALMTVLKRMGHQPTLIMRRHNKPKVSVKYKIKLFVTGLLKTILTFKKHQIIYDVEYDFNKKGKDMHKFVNEFMQPQTPYLYDTVSLKKYCDGKFDAYIVGSDQVWRAIYVPDIKNYFLDFTEGWNIRRIAFAASFGTDTPEYTPVQIEQCGELLKTFDGISLREKSGMEVFKHFGWSIDSVQVVLDPTMLLSAKDYSKILPVNKAKSVNKIFYYVLDRNQIIESVLIRSQTLLGKEIFGISNIQKGDNVLIPIEEWLVNIRDADFVITDSFHGMVFSIIFHKPFVVSVNLARGADRFTSLLSLLGIENRMLTPTRQVKDVVLNDIDWEKVDEKLLDMKTKSKAFFKEVLVNYN